MFERLHMSIFLTRTFGAYLQDVLTYFPHPVHCAHPVFLRIISSSTEITYYLLVVVFEILFACPIFELSPSLFAAERI